MPWITPSPPLMPSLMVWSMETALNWSLPYILSLTLSPPKSSLQNIKLIMSLIWLRSFYMYRCPQNKVSLLAENSQSCSNLSWLLSQQHVQNSGLTPGHSCPLTHPNFALLSPLARSPSSLYAAVSSLHFLHRTTPAEATVPLYVFI